MSIILEKGNNRVKCQKFTPDMIVQTMLDLCGYNNNLMGKTVLENSFGTGNILTEIVTRYIKDALNAGNNKHAISFGLSHDIYGVELDKKLYDECIKRLNHIVKEFSLPKVNWKLFCGDALEISFNTQFDFVIGNPPYISYKEMDIDSRNSVREKYVSCSVGKYDYCYAFIESGINQLKCTGKLVQLVPNNVFKNVFAQKLREQLKENITIVYDYPDQKLFDKTLTSVCLFIYEQNNASSFLHYKNMTNGQERMIPKRTLGDKWTFDNITISSDATMRFGDVFNASITIATLYNKAYLVSKDDIQTEQIESDVINKAVSPRSLQQQKEYYIIFPYRFVESGLVHYTPSEFESLYPNAARHLKLFSKELAGRNSDDNIAWFEYGRSQALSHMNTEKIIMPTIITRKVEVHKIDKKTIPYSGIYITVKDPHYSLDDAISLLNSNPFMEYIRKIGICVNGKSIRITCKDINNYRFIGVK